MKRGNKKFNNRLLYSLISLILIIVVLGGVYAVDTTQAWHSAGQIDFVGDTSFKGVGTTGVNSRTSLLFFDSNGITRRGYIGDSSLGDSNIYLTAETGNLILSGNNIGIGTSNPGSKLEIYDGYLTINSPGLGWGTNQRIRSAGPISLMPDYDNSGDTLIYMLNPAASPTITFNSANGDISSGDIMLGGHRLYTIAGSNDPNYYIQSTSETSGLTFKQYGGGFKFSTKHGQVANIDEEGNIYGKSFIYTSDKSLKENIKPLINPLDKVNQLQGVSFNWKMDGNESIGLIAQDVEKVLPQLVHTNEEGLKSVEYGNLVALLIEAVKEQQKEIDELKSQLNK